MGRGGREGWLRRGSMRWSSGWRCCGAGWRRVTTGWMRFWRGWMSRRKGKETDDEQVDVEDGGRHACDRDEAICGFAGGGVPRAYRSEDRAKVAAGAEWV